MNEPDSSTSAQPAPGEDSRVEDWFGQSVKRDTELAEELVDEFGEEEAERRFDAETIGADEQDGRRGASVDPDQGVSAYRDASPDRDDETDRPSSR